MHRAPELVRHFQGNCHYSAQATIVEFRPHSFPSMPDLDPSRQQTDLAGLQWQLGSVPQLPWPDTAQSGLVTTDIDRVDAWLPGTVPGTVQSDLLSLGRIPDPFLEDNFAACQWVERLDWWYRAALPLQLDPGQRAFLEFDGGDTLSALFVNGQELCRHEGMFSRQTVEIPPALAANPKAELAVRLWGSEALPSYELTAGEQVWSRVAGMAKSSFRPFDDRLATLKAPMHSGWDFAPRLRTMGIWQAFYDLCDELGLLVWQEFPIACVFLDHLPRTKRFRRLLHQEATGVVQALRNHPSLFLWCGGNEFSPRRNRQAVATLSQVVASEDGLRPFVAASPGPGDVHNWQVWHGQAPLAAYRDERAAFVSEFGLQAVPNVDSLRRFLSGANLWPPDLAWRHHNADLEKLHRYAQWFGGGNITANNTTNTEKNAATAHELKSKEVADTNAHVTSKATEDTALESFVQATQRAQAAGLQILVEHMRRCAGPSQPGRGPGQTGGLAVWQWNDPWPAISWSVIDAFGQPKLAYETLRRIYQPVLISLEYPLRAYRPNDHLCGTLWVVNDRLEALVNCHLTVWLDDGLVHEQDCRALANTATPIGQVAVDLPAGFAELRLELRQRNDLLAQNVYDLRFHDCSPRRLDQILRRRLVDIILE